MTAINAQGTTFTIGATEVGGMKSYSGFDGEATEKDVTNLASTAKEFTLGLIDNGSFGIEFFPDFGDAGQEALRAAAISGASGTFVLTLTDSTTATFTGYVKTAHKIDGSVDGVVEGSASIRITGAVTWA